MSLTKRWIEDLASLAGVEPDEFLDLKTDEQERIKDLYWELKEQQKQETVECQTIKQ